MGINRIKLQDGSPAEMIKAQEAAASDPALDTRYRKRPRYSTILFRFWITKFITIYTSFS